ncbi:MAG: hypothetical protein Q8N45_02295 [Anaerolineales bacterium]|nr:hypothetical protein [Anaerolineales bacterium]
MDERKYFIHLAGGSIIRVRYQKDRRRIQWFLVQLEAFIGSGWIAITRYDTAHGFVHRDELRPNGEQIKSPPMMFATLEDALNFAIRDLRSNYQWYLERYEQWKN